MKIIQAAKFRSSDFYDTETSPLRVVGRYELELYDGGEGFSVIGGIKYPHNGRHFLLAHPGDRRFSIGRFECLYVHFESDEPEVAQIARFMSEPDSDAVDEMKRIIASDGLVRLAGLCTLLEHLRNGELQRAVKPNEPVERYLDAVMKTKEYMEQNYGNKISLEQLAGMVYLSKNFYRTVFSRVMEMSPSRYLTSIRVAKATGLILEGRLSFGEIAGLCGFENQSYMNYVLKKETGKTPGEIAASGR